jgi:hypothetical protein
LQQPVLSPDWESSETLTTPLVFGDGTGDGAESLVTSLDQSNLELQVDGSSVFDAGDESGDSAVDSEMAENPDSEAIPDELTAVQGSLADPGVRSGTPGAAAPLVLAVSEAGQVSGAPLQQTEVEREQALRDALGDISPPVGSPEDLSPASLQQLLQNAVQAIQSSAGGGGQ